MRVEPSEVSQDRELSEQVALGRENVRKLSERDALRLLECRALVRVDDENAHAGLL